MIRERGEGVGGGGENEACLRSEDLRTDIKETKWFLAVRALERRGGEARRREEQKRIRRYLESQKSWSL